MQTTVTDVNECKKIMEVEFPYEKVREIYDNKLKKASAKAEIPGFRQGKAPLKMVENRFGQSILAESFEDAVSSGLREAFEKNKMNPIGSPEISDIDFKEDQPVKFKATFEIENPVEIKKYKGFGIKPEKTKVEDKEVEAEIDAIRDKMATLKTAEREVREGDYIEMEYKEAVIDGRETPDIPSPEHPVEVGKSSIPEFDKAAVGAKAGEEKTIEFTFPDNYPTESARGKKAKFVILIKEVKEKILPPADDELAKDAGDFKDLADLKGKISSELLEQKEKQSKGKAAQEIISRIIEENPFDVAEARIDMLFNYRIEMMKKQNMPMDNIDRDGLREKTKDDLVKEIKTYRILDSIAKQEDIKVDQKEVDEEIGKIAEYRGEEFDKVKDELRKSGYVLDIRERLKEQKTYDFLLENQ
ncbi:MAG: trigger factor [Fibrobacterota bacterium]